MGVKESVKQDSFVVIPPRYKVILLNDDYTSMDFVVEVLVTIFGHTLQRAVEIMLSIHEQGSEVCGVYTYEIAQTKLSQVESKAQQEQFPLRAIMQEE